jgi:hypothetical protein
MKIKITQKQLNKITEKITCKKCSWSWLFIDGGDDPYMCHKCGCNNENFIYEDSFGSVELTSFTETNILNEAEYKGRKVILNKPMQGDVKKFKVYVKNDKGNIVKVNFGFGGTSAKGKRMVIKKNNPKRRKAFRSRFNCDNPGPKWFPRFWSCRAWI